MHKPPAQTAVPSHDCSHYCCSSTHTCCAHKAHTRIQTTHPAPPVLSWRPIPQPYQPLGSQGSQQAARPCPAAATTTATPLTALLHTSHVIPCHQLTRRPHNTVAVPGRCRTAGSKAGSCSDCLLLLLFQSSSLAAPVAEKPSKMK
jgi:hypothetical protein